MAELLSSFQKSWQSLGAAQRAGIVLVMAGIAALVGGIGWFGSRTEWRTIASGADAKQVAEILSALEQAKIPVQMGAGDSVQVPQNLHSAATMEIVKRGLNRDGLGFELLDQTNAFMTSALEQMNVQRSFMGEIERNLRSWPGIASARVIIATERESWLRDEKGGSAAVSLTLRPGVRLTPADVAGVQSFVASSWRSLKAENVTVVADGKKLSRDPGGTDGESFTVASDQISMQAEYENQLGRKAQAALDVAFGAGKARVEVSAELDFDSRVETVGTIDDEKKVTLSESTTETVREGGSGAVVGGPTGASANLPSASGEPRTAEDRGKETTKTADTKFEYPRSQLTSKKNGFSLKRLSVALLADASLQPRQTELEGVVKAAVGFSTRRSDQFSSAFGAEFPKPVDDVATQAPPPTSTYLPDLLATGGRVVTVLGLVVMFLFVLKRANRAPAERERGVLVPARAGGGGSAAGGGYSAADGVPGAIPADEGTGLADSPQLSPAFAARANVAKSAAAAALADPPVAGRVVRTWLESKNS